MGNLAVCSCFLIYIFGSYFLLSDLYSALYVHHLFDSPKFKIYSPLTSSVSQIIRDLLGIRFP